MTRHNNPPKFECQQRQASYGRQCITCGIDTVTAMAMPIYAAPDNIRKPVRGRMYQSDKAYTSGVFYSNELSRYTVAGEYVKDFGRNINSLTGQALKTFYIDMLTAFAANGLRPENLCRLDVFIDMDVIPSLAALQSNADKMSKKDKLRIVIGHNGIVERVLWYRGNGVWHSDDGSDDFGPVSSDAAFWKAITDRAATVYIGNKSRLLCIYCKPRGKQRVFRYETRFRTKKTLNRAAYGKCAPESNFVLLKDLNALHRVMSTAAAIVAGKAFCYADDRPAYFVNRTLRRVMREQSRARIAARQKRARWLQHVKTVEKLDCLSSLSKFIFNSNNHVSILWYVSNRARHNGRSNACHSPPESIWTMAHGGSGDICLRCCVVS